MVVDDEVGAAEEGASAEDGAVLVVGAGVVEVDGAGLEEAGSDEAGAMR